mgnify:CR=1 FL=1
MLRFLAEMQSIHCLKVTAHCLSDRADYRGGAIATKRFLEDPGQFGVSKINELF